MNQATLKKEMNEKQKEITAEIENYKEKPADFLKLLDFMARFYTYSPRNVVLITKQWEGAYAVGSFKHWQELGYCVNKGEHSKIKILVPIAIKTFTTANGKNKGLKYATKAEKQAIKQGKLKVNQRTAFKYGNVFDITQTNVPQEDYPKLFPNRHFDYKINSETANKILDGLKDYAKKLNLTIATDQANSLGNAKGAFFMSPDSKGIKLNPRNNPGENIAVLIHELGHASLHQNSKLTTGEEELQAEMTSYLVSAHFGIDTSEESTAYIAGWTDKLKDVKNLEKLLSQVQKAARKIIENIG